MEENTTQETPTETKPAEPQEQPPAEEAAPQEPTPEPIQTTEPVVAPEQGPITELPVPMPAPKAPEKPSVGRIVHYVLKSGRSAGQHRPMLVVNVFSQTSAQYVNAQVFLDGANDFGSEFQQYEGNNSNQAWATSVPYSAEQLPGTWHWPERV